jgi:alkylation response protein AidB-like acyl-CoA dehydrogenase
MSETRGRTFQPMTTEQIISQRREVTDWLMLADDIGIGLRDGVSERDRTGQLSLDAYRHFRESGLSAALVPVEFGGGGISHELTGTILRNLGRHDGSTAVALSMHMHLVAAQVWRHKRGMDAEKILRKVAGGAILVSTGASDWVPSNGTTTRVDGGYRVSGRKSPASGCEAGDVLVSSMRWEGPPDGPKVIHFAVPFSAPGVSVELTWDTLGLRASGSHTVVLDDVFVPDDAVALVRSADAWPPIYNVVMTAAMPLIMSAYLGIADAAVDLAIEAAQRSGRPHLVGEIGEMVNAHLRAEDTVTAMMQSSKDLTFDNDDLLASRTLARKTTATTAMIETVRLAVEIAGGSAYSRSSDLERLLRDVHASMFHPLPHAAQIGFTGRVALGMSPI